MSDFTMPSLGADMEDGTFVEWLVAPGDTVKRGQVVCVVETQKGAVEVEIWTNGVVDALIAEPGQKIPVGGVMAKILVKGEAPAARESVAAKPAPEKRGVPEPEVRPSAGSEAPAKGVQPLRSATRLRITPAARRRAEALGVDPAKASATGVDGAITLADVERAAVVSPSLQAPSKPTVKDDAEARRSAMRDAIAAAMSLSNREIPHYYLGTTIDVAPALAWLEAHNAGLPTAGRVLFAVLQLRAVALALREVPALNGWYENGVFRPAEACHIGVAIALRGGGLVAPALRDADRLPIDATMTALADLLRRTRAGQLRSSELSETSITVTNLGDLGVETVQGVIYPPQVALVGFGRITEKPWAENGRLFATRCVHASLAADHRVTDGAIGARFLARVADLLSRPETLWQD